MVMHPKYTGQIWMWRTAKLQQERDWELYGRCSVWKWPCINVSCDESIDRARVSVCSCVRTLEWVAFVKLLTPYSLLKITRSCIRLCGQASVWKLTVHSVVWCNLDSLNGANVYVKPRKSEAIEEKWEMGNVNISGCLFITYTFVIEVKP